jgi:small subunit ribosomal protein S2
LKAVEETVAKGGVVLFLGTKKQVREAIEKYAKEVEMPYVSERWVGGTITNFHEIYRLVRKLESLEKKIADEDYEKKYTKRERGLFEEEKENLDKAIGGIRNMKKLPDMVYVAGVRDEKTAVKEIGTKKVKCMGICDSNVDPSKVTYPVAANDDAVKSLEMITRLVAEAVKVGKDRQGKQEEKKDKDKAVKNLEQKDELANK